MNIDLTQFKQRFLAMLCLGCSLWFWIPAGYAAKTFITSESETVLVTTQPIANIQIYPSHDVPATVLSLQDSVLSAEIQGQILELPAKVGESVSQNQILATIDCVDYELQLASAIADRQAIESDLELTRWQLARTEQLATQNNASEERLRQYRSSLKKQEANLERQRSTIKTAQNQVSKCSVRAPFTGIIVNRMANLGEYTTPGTQLLHLLDTQNLEVEALLHNSEITSIKQASTIAFQSNGKEFPVTLRTIVPKQDPKFRTQLLRFTFPKAVPLPGTAGRLTWKAKFPAIPAEYIRQIGSDLGIFVAKDNQAHFIVLPQAIEGQPVPLLKPITDPVIIDGRYAISPQSPIKIQSFNKQEP